MKKIETKEHTHLMEVFEKYKKYYKLYGDITVAEEQDEVIRRNATELQGIYDYYRILMIELEKCSEKYHSIRNSLKTTMYSPVRKMNTIDKNRK